MRAARVLSFAAILLLCGVATAPAQQVTEGVYEVSGCVNTLLLPPEFQVPGLPDLGPDVYHGILTLEPQADGTTLATFSGSGDSEGQPGNTAGPPGEATAVFAAGWPGLVIGPLIIGGERVEDCIVRIGHEYLVSASLTGIGHVDGEIRRVVKLEFGPQGALLRFKDVPAPAIYR